MGTQRSESKAACILYPVHFLGVFRQFLHYSSAKGQALLISHRQRQLRIHLEITQCGNIVFRCFVLSCFSLERHGRPTTTSVPKGTTPTRGKIPINRGRPRPRSTPQTSSRATRSCSPVAASG